MARLPRYSLPGQPQHVIQRGNNGQPIFMGGEDYLFYYECLATAAKTQGCDIHAYVFMTNHVHLLVTPHTDGAIGRTMQSIGRKYVQYFNYTHHRTGTLWEGRYRAGLIDAEGYLLTCYRYIELNPVRAAMVKHPRDYRWSSYRCHAVGQEDTVITDHKVYKALGKDETLRRAAYRALFRSHLNEETLRDIRDALHKGWVLGGDGFKKRISGLAQRRVAPLPKGRPAKQT